MSLDVMLSVNVFSRNITHNLGRMAAAAGLYEALWRPEEIGCWQARDLIPLLETGLLELEADPDRFKQYNPENGWGSYEGLVEFVRDYLIACKVTPNAYVEASR